MMKHIAKHTLLFGAFAMLLSTMPMQAMEEAPADVQQEVGTKKGFFGRWTERAKNLRMKNLIRELNRAWKPFIACVEKGKEDCSQRAKVVRNIITSILALVVITGVGIGAAKARDVWQRGFKPRKPVEGREAVYGKLESSLTPKGQELMQLTERYINDPINQKKPIMDHLYKTSDKAALESALKRLEVEGFDRTSEVYRKLVTKIGK